MQPLSADRRALRRLRIPICLGALALAACVRPAAGPVPPTPATPRPARETATPQLELTQAAAERAAVAGATGTAIVADRIATAETRAADATATAEVESVPPFGLVGQQISACSERHVPFDLVVEDAEVFDHPDGGLVVIAVVRVTNHGTEGSDLFSSLRLRDRQGRVYDYRLADRAFLLYTYEQKYGARGIREWIQPGLSARQIWGYTVPTDVVGLRPVAGRGYTCR